MERYISMHASAPMGTTFNNPFIQNNLQISSISCTATSTQRSYTNKLTITNICFIEVLSEGAIVTRFASITVDTLRVVSTVLAYTAPLIVTMDV
jgi:hypothetical protein